MKKTFVLATVFILAFALLFAGCAKNASDDAQDAVQADSAGDAADDSAADDASADEGQDGTTNGELTPADSYTRYLDAKTAVYDSISEKIDENDALTMTVGLQLVAVSMVDLSAIDLEFITSDVEASETAAAMLGTSDLEISYNGGEDFTMTYTGSDDNAVVVTGKYDGATDSLTATWTVNGSETLMLEYVTYNSGYAGQYLVYNNDGMTSIIKVIVDGDNMGFGLSDDDTLASIYKTAPADFSFLDDCTTVVHVQDGEGVSVIDGETTTF